MTVAYALLIYIDERFFRSDVVISFFEPASGLALAALLLGGLRFVWAVLAGALVANGILEDSVAETVFISVGDTAGALCGAWLLARDSAFDRRRYTLETHLRLTFIAGAGGVAIGALIGSTGLLATGAIAAEDYARNLFQWWKGDMLGVILVTPLILVWWQKPERFGTRKSLEAALLFGMTFLAGQVIFLGWFSETIGHLAKAFWMFLPVAWIAARLGSRRTTIALLIVALQGLLGAYQGVGYFASDIANTHLFNFWVYIFALALTGMMLAVHLEDRRRTEKELRRVMERYDLATSIGRIGTWDWNLATGEMTWNNETFCLLALAPASVTPSFELFLQRVHPEDRELIARAVHAVRTEEGMHEVDFRVMVGGNEERSCHITGKAEFDDRGQPLRMLGTIQDITERKRIEQEIHTLAFYDALTGLPNRRLLSDRIRTAIAASKRSGRYGAVMFIDLDNFKPLNDAHGHDMGDLLLVEVAQRLTRCVREADTVARFGGDEFVVVLGELDSDRAGSAEQADIVAEKIRTALGEPYVLKFEQEGQTPATVEHRCTSSIGVALFVNHTAHPEEILKHADMAMYQAKEDGRDRIHFHQD